MMQNLPPSRHFTRRENCSALPRKKTFNLHTYDRSLYVATPAPFRIVHSIRQASMDIRRSSLADHLQGLSSSSHIDNTH